MMALPGLHPFARSLLGVGAAGGNGFLAATLVDSSPGVQGRTVRVIGRSPSTSNPVPPNPGGPAHGLGNWDFTGLKLGVFPTWTRVGPQSGTGIAENLIE